MAAAHLVKSYCVPTAYPYIRLWNTACD